jgi:hypothetical protein
MGRNFYIFKEIVNPTENFFTEVRRLEIPFKHFRHFCFLVYSGSFFDFIEDHSFLPPPRLLPRDQPRVTRLG